jgi:hypothetical protein
LEAGSAQDLSNYSLVALEKTRKNDQRKDKLIALASATYGPTPGTVTLTLRGKVPNQTLQLVGQSGAMLGAEGDPIASPGSSIVVTLGSKGGISLARVRR